MPDFPIQTTFSAKDRVTQNFKNMGKAADKFGNKSTNAFRKASKSGGSLISKLTSVRGLLAGAGTAIVAGKLSQSIVKTAELGDEAAKTARRLGITAEALQEMRFAADRQGVSSSVLGSSFTALQKRVGELRAGTGSLFSFLNKTGDKAFANQLKGAKNTEEAFTLLTEKMGKVKNPMDRAALASAAFSRAGVDMLKFMEIGSKGIKVLREDARKYGAVISDDAAGKSELFIDALTNMKSSFSGIGNIVGAMVIPRITELMTRVADFIMVNREMLSLNIGKFFRGLGRAFETLKTFAPLVVDAFKKMKDLFIIIKPFLPALAAGMIAYMAASKTLLALGMVVKFVKFVKVLRSAAIAQGLLNAVMLLNPIGLIAVGVGLLAAGAVLLIKKWEPARKFFSDMFEKMTAFVSKFANVRGIAGKIGGFFGMDTKSGAGAPAITPPNQTEIEARKQIDFKGRLDIAGAPKGSSVSGETTGAPAIQMELLGANP